MRILLDRSYGLRGPSGTAVYIERLERELEALGVEVIGVQHEERRSPGGGALSSLRNLRADYEWTHKRLPEFARRHAVDLIHHPLPAWSDGAGCPQVCTIHDLAFELLPDQFDRRYRYWASINHRRATRKCHTVIAVSDLTANDAMRLWDVPRGKLVVAKHGPGQWERDDVALPKLYAAGTNVAGDNYLLYIGDDQPRKDLGTLRAAFAKLRARLGDAAPTLVLAGSAESQGQDGVLAIKNPPAQQLRELLAGARMLVHPSRHEGSGLTPLEAMVMRVPVVAARSAGVVDSCGNGVAYAEVGDSESLANVISDLLLVPEQRKRLLAAAEEVLAHRSWQGSAQSHVQAYTLAIGRNHGRAESLS